MLAGRFHALLPGLSSPTGLARRNGLARLAGLPHRARLTGLAMALLPAVLPIPAAARQQAVRADVVVIVDTSTSMRERGMDPERASLLVTKLLADIVPGDLAVVRLLDLHADAADVPSRPTGIRTPCNEDPTQTCERVEPSDDWQANARRRKLGALVRPARGDAEFKRQLESHLEQRCNNSLFDLAFRAAQGIFDSHPAADPAQTPRFAIWLSDGRPENPAPLTQVLHELTAASVNVEAVVFGQGDPAFARGAGLGVRQVASPAEIMKAFAAAFRRMVQAPYELDGRIADLPSFDIKPQVDEAWIVVYGDDSLGDVELTGPAGTVRADYAADRWPGAGAYRVAYLTQPPAGRWTVRAAGGGAGVAYAVVQRSSLAPFLIAPRTAFAGAPATLIAGLRAGRFGPPIADPAVLAEATLTAETQGQTLHLTAAADGRFTAGATFHGIGKVPVRLHLRSPLVDRISDESVDVSGHFAYTGGPLDIDLGTLGVAARTCRPLLFQADHQGEVPFTLRALRSLPAGHTLALRLAAGTLIPGGPPLAAPPGGRLEVCLSTSPRAPSSLAAGEPWLDLVAAGGATAQQRLTLRLRWKVRGLTFWQRWRQLILWILALLVLAFVVAGYVVPQRFHGSFAIVYVPERDELDELSPQPVRQWRGVGIGFYRNAHAFLHADFRLSGRPRGAVAGLHAEKAGPRVVPGSGGALYREALDATWEPVPPEGRRGRPGDVYRVGERGPFFRISSWRGRR
jgi:hypothetical protein